MAGDFVTRRRIEFADTDMAGIVHFSRFFVFMETAEVEFLSSLGILPGRKTGGRPLFVPRVAARCEYLQPARFGDEVEIRVRVAKIGTKSVTYRHEFRINANTIARGEITAVWCTKLEDGTIESLAIPAHVRDQLQLWA